MKRIALVATALALSACASVGPPMPQPAPLSDTASPRQLLAHWPGDYDNHGQVWQARQAHTAIVPVHVRHHIEAVAGADNAWIWHLSMPLPDGGEQQATWRYVARTLADGRLRLTPSWQLSNSGDEDEPRWAELAPCALEGGASHGRLQLRANQTACSAIIAGLGGHAALMPLFLGFDGNTLIAKTYSDIARGPEAREIAQRVRWYQAWVAINGAGPQATSTDTDWHMQRDLRIGNQGQSVPIKWRDGMPSGYALKLETLTYRERDLRVLQLSLVRADGQIVAYVWADPDSRHIGLNLAWVQAGLAQARRSR